MAGKSKVTCVHNTIEFYLFGFPIILVDKFSLRKRLISCSSKESSPLPPRAFHKNRQLDLVANQSRIPSRRKRRMHQQLPHQACWIVAYFEEHISFSAKARMNEVTQKNLHCGDWHKQGFCPLAFIYSGSVRMSSKLYVHLVVRLIWGERHAGHLKNYVILVLGPYRDIFACGRD